jgi:hypothetical protein
MAKQINTRTERRGQSKNSRRDQRGSSSITTRRTPPVLSRSTIGVNTAAVDNRPIPRRRVDVAIASGAEIRLPAVPAVHNKWRVLSGVISICLLMGLILFTQSELFTITDIEIQGLERFTEGDIAQAINITGSSIFFINPDRVKRDLQMTYPALSDIDIQVGWPASVSISLVERYPVLAWNWDGRVRWVDNNGVAYDPLDEGLDVVQVKSTMLPPTIDDHIVDPRIVESVASLAGYIPENVDLVYDPDHGLGWEDDRGWITYFGFNDDDTEQKMNVYQSLVEYLEGKRITPGIINVEFIDSPYFRMEQ